MLWCVPVPAHLAVFDLVNLSIHVGEKRENVITTHMLLVLLHTTHVTDFTSIHFRFS